MTTESESSDPSAPAALSRMAQNLKKVEALTERLTRVMASREGHQPALDAPNQQLFAKAAQSYWAEAMTNPARLMEHQMGYWTKSVTHFVEAQQALASGAVAPVRMTACPTNALPIRFGRPIPISALSNSSI